MLLTGGTVANADGTVFTALASAELFDPGSGTFSPTCSMTATRSRATATLLPNGRILVAGGIGDGGAGGTGVASAELYDPGQRHVCLDRLDDYAVREVSGP